MTRAILLAAGRGERLGRHTRQQPKASVRAGGRSLLDWNLRALAACGVDRIACVGGYRHDCLADARANLIVNAAWASGGPLQSLQAAGPDRLEDAFLVVYGDCVHHPDNLRALLDAHADVAVAGDRCWSELWRERQGDPLVDAESYRALDGRLLDIGAAPIHALEAAQAQFAGLVKFTPQGWRSALRAIDRHACTDMTGLLAALLRDGLPVADVPIRGRWCEIDSANDLALCRRRLREPQPWRHDWRSEAEQRRCR